MTNGFLALESNAVRYSAACFSFQRVLELAEHFLRRHLPEAVALERPVVDQACGEF